MAKRKPRPKGVVYPEWLIEDALDRGMHPADLEAELEEVRQAVVRMAGIDRKKLEEMQKGVGDLELVEA